MSKNYLQRLEKSLSKWKLATEVQVIRSKFLVDVDAGYLRMRVRLVNDDLLEVSEYVTGESGKIELINYSYHWQGVQGRLKKRWANAPHHPVIESHPFHVHEADDQNILASEPITLRKILQLIEKEVKTSK
ncbi:DUF6516 family protein [bacterium]|nr:DUF6516 family protein [bacterium]